MFFRYLGKKDVSRKWQEKVERLGENSEGLIAFSAYFGGMGESDTIHANKRLEELVEAARVTGEAIINATRYLPGGLAGVRRVTKLIREKRIDPEYVGRVVSGGGWMDSLAAEDCLCLLEAIAGPSLENAAAVIDFLGMWLHSKKVMEGELAEFAWKCLEAAPPVASDEAYGCEGLAAKLAESDIERGFRLLNKLLMQPYDRKSWNPIDRYGAQENRFWAVLHKADRQRALRTVFSVATKNSLHRLRVSWDLEDILYQQNDADILIELAIESKDQAVMVAESITTAKPGFWPIAFEIIRKYRNDLNIQDTLTRGIEQMGQVYEGSYSQHLESCRKDVGRQLKNPAAPTAACSWLREILSRLQGEIAQHVIWEYDEDVNDLRRYIEDRDSPERIWAIGRVLKYAELKDIRKLLTVEDIAEALPQVDLPEKKRKALEKAIEVWQGGS